MPLSLATTGSAKLRPIRRLMANRVLVGLVTAWRLAGWPTTRSSPSSRATIEGVVRTPSAFSMTLGFLPSMMATHELVVPRSMPIILAIDQKTPLEANAGRGPCHSSAHGKSRVPGLHLQSRIWEGAGIAQEVPYI